MKVGGVVGGLCVMGAVLQPCLLQGGCRYQARLEGRHWIMAIALSAERASMLFRVLLPRQLHALTK